MLASLCMCSMPLFDRYDDMIAGQKGRRASTSVQYLSLTVRFTVNRTSSYHHKPWVGRTDIIFMVGIRGLQWPSAWYLGYEMQIQTSPYGVRVVPNRCKHPCIQAKYYTYESASHGRVSCAVILQLQ